MKKKILFLCTGNSCRSQMAQGWGHHLKSEKFEFYSAGTQKDHLNSRAVKVMDEVGIDISSHYSKEVDELENIQFDWVMTVCSDAHETCPTFFGAKVVHVGFEDPPRLTKEMKSEAEILDVYRKIRDQIKNMVQNIESYLIQP